MHPDRREPTERQARPAPGAPRALALALALAWALALILAPPAGPPRAMAQGGGPAPQAPAEGPAPAPQGLDGQGQAARGGGPIAITSDRMVADDASRKVTFSGKVVARQGDLIISCDRMLVSYQPRSPQGSQGPGGGAPGGEPGTPGLAPGQGIAQGQAQGPPPGQAQAGDRPQGPGGRDGSPLEGGQEIDQVTCEGAVKIQQGDRLAVGDQALYLAKAVPRRLVLTGQARVWQGENSVTGHRITYFLDENRSHVDSQGGGRVRAFYDQGGAPRP